MRELGVSPLTWTYVKLLGRQLRDNVRDWDELPNSHAWAASPSSRPRRLLTKAQCVGVLVSIHERAERAELLIDDGTALVRAVLWSPSWDEQIALGDLVRIEGKLNMDSSWASDNKIVGVQSTRELRVVRLHKIVDPNEELLHWLEVTELTTTVYGSGAAASASTAIEDGTPAQRPYDRSPATWDCIVSRAFHELEVDDAEVTAFLGRADPSPHDQMLIDTLRDLLSRQRKQSEEGSDGDLTVRFRFPDLLRDALGKESVAAADALHHATTRSLRHAFTKLRSSGLVFLEDTNSDQYVFLSAAFALAPSLMKFLQSTFVLYTPGTEENRLTIYHPGVRDTEKASGASIAEIAEWVLTQDRYKRISIDSLENTLQRLLHFGQLEQGDDSQQFYFSRVVSTNR